MASGGRRSRRRGPSRRVSGAAAALALAGVVAAFDRGRPGRAPAVQERRAAGWPAARRAAAARRAGGGGPARRSARRRRNGSRRTGNGGDPDRLRGRLAAGGVQTAPSQRLSHPASPRRVVDPAGPRAGAAEGHARRLPTDAVPSPGPRDQWSRALCPQPRGAGGAQRPIRAPAGGEDLSRRGGGGAGGGVGADRAAARTRRAVSGTGSRRWRRACCRGSTP